MKKIILSSINLFNYISEATKRSFKEQILKSITLNRDATEYILLSVNGDADALHSGIISFSKNSFNMSFIGMFSISRESVNNIVTYSSNNNYKFYKVNYNNVEYIAIKKPLAGLENCHVMTFEERFNATFTAARESELTNIIAL